MAGSAAGAAAARARRAEKLAIRHASNAPPQQSISHATESGESLIQADRGSVGLLPATAPIFQAGHQLGAVLLDQLQPEAVRELASAMRQRRSPALRFTAACKLIDLGIGRKAEKAGAGEPGEEALLTRIGDALQLRSRAAAAVDARVVGEDPVTPAGSGHSAKAPDRQSD